MVAVAVYGDLPKGKEGLSSREEKPSHGDKRMSHRMGEASVPKCKTLVTGK